MPVKKKAKQPEKKMTLDKLAKLADEKMDEFVAESKDRYAQAHTVYVIQDNETQDAIERIAEVLMRIARRRMWFGVGAREDRVVREIPEEAINCNAWYMAVQIVKDLAVLDIQIDNYKHPKGQCAMCGIEINPKKKGR